MAKCIKFDINKAKSILQILHKKYLRYCQNN